MQGNASVLQLTINSVRLVGNIIEYYVFKMWVSCKICLWWMSNEWRWRACVRASGAASINCAVVPQWMFIYSLTLYILLLFNWEFSEFFFIFVNKRQRHHVAVGVSINYLIFICSAWLVIKLCLLSMHSICNKHFGWTSCVCGWLGDLFNWPWLFDAHFYIYVLVHYQVLLRMNYISFSPRIGFCLGLRSRFAFNNK